MQKCPPVVAKRVARYYCKMMIKTSREIMKILKIALLLSRYATKKKEAGSNHIMSSM